MRARLAWLLAGATFVLAVADVLVTAAYRPLLSEEAMAQHGFPFVNLAVVGSALLGAVIVSRFDRHAIGWLLNLIGVIGAFSQLAEALNIWVLHHGGPGPRGAAGVSGWLAASFGGQFAIGELALMFLLAPDGRLLSRRWRYAGAAVVAGELCCLVALAAGDPTQYDFQAGDIGAVRGVLFSVGFLLIGAGLVASLVSMLIRLRRSRGEDRQAVRLIALAASLLVVGVASVVVVQALNGGRQTWTGSLPLFISYLCLPVLFAVAVLRYRLYDIDVIINRAVVLAAATVFAAVGYISLVVFVDSQVGSRGDGWLVSLLGTTVVALAFQPLRRWVVHLANRLAYGPRARPYVALSDFSRRLAETPSADTLLPAVADAAARAVSARGATAALDLPGVGVISSVCGDVGSEAATPYDVPVRSGGATLGRVTVFVPRGRPLRAADARLLQALADQAAVAFRNTATETQLAEHVAALDRTTRALTESRTRIIDADNAARRTLAAAISREVHPLLLALPGQLRRSRRAVAAGAGDNGLDHLVQSTNAALEALRELTRGVFPTQLARSGLEPALRSHLSRIGLSSALSVDEAAVGARFSERVETAVYFCCAEAAPALRPSSEVRLSMTGEGLELRITGVQHDTIELQGILDRVDAAGGTLETGDELIVLRVPDGSVVDGRSGRGPGVR